MNVAVPTVVSLESREKFQTLTAPREELGIGVPTVSSIVSRDLRKTYSTNPTDDLVNVTVPIATSLRSRTLLIQYTAWVPEKVDVALPVVTSLKLS